MTPLQVLIGYTVLIPAIVLDFLMHLPSIFKKPSLDGAWEPHHRNVPIANTVDGDITEIQNVRHCRYTSEFKYDLTWTTETFDPKKILRVWYTLCPWGYLNFQAHSWLTFDFEDGKSIVIAIEVRKQNSFTFIAYETLYKNYNLFYIIADEADILYLRTHIWKNETRMYPLRLSAEQRQNVWAAAMNRVQFFAKNAVWYRFTTSQCNTEATGILRAAGLSLPRWHPKYIIVGWCDQVLFKCGLIDSTSRTFNDCMKEHTLNLEEVNKIALSDDFSLSIRKLVV